MPLPLTSHSCRCGRLLDGLRHHRSACPVVGVLGRRGFPLESAAARICREVGGRVRTNVLVRDLDLHAINNLDSRRLEVVVDGLSLFRGAQLAIDTTLVSPLSRNGTTRPRYATVSGAALDQARIRKERRYPEVAGDHGRACLVVLAREIGGRFSSETAQFLRGRNVRDSVQAWRDEISNERRVVDEDLLSKVLRTTSKQKQLERSARRTAPLVEQGCEFSHANERE